MKNRFKLKGCFIFALILALIVSTVPVMAFAEATDQWVVKASPSVIRFGFGLESLNDKIYLIGGGGVNDNRGSLDTVEEYNPAINRWNTISSLNVKRRYLQTVVLNEKIYAIGGINDITGFLTSVEEYNPSSNKWTVKEPMSESRAVCQTAVLNGKIYAFGGYTVGGNDSTTMEEYDPSTNKWTTKASVPSVKRNFNKNVIVDNGKIYAFGDYSNPLSSLEIYDPELDKWTIKQAPFTSGCVQQTYLINGKIYLLCNAYGEESLSKLVVYDPITDSWNTRSPMSTARSSFDSQLLNGKIYVFGGDLHPEITDEYDPNTDKWQARASMPVTRNTFRSAIANGKIYTTESIFSDFMEEYTPAASQPDMPTSLTATFGDKQVSLSWSPVAGATGYNIYRSTTSGSSYTKIASDVTSETYTDTGLTNGVTYYYYVTAVDSSGTESQPSNEASATPTAPSSGGYNATLKITMVTGEIKEYNVNSTVVESFISWFNSKGSESLVFTFEKTSDLGPYTSHTDYLAYDKISSFMVLKY